MFSLVLLTAHVAALAGLTLTIGFGVLTLEGIRNVVDRTRADTRKPGVAESLRSLWQHMQQLGNLDLQFVSWGATNAADKVVADVACKLYALFLAKPSASTVDAWFKGSNHATVTAANGDVTVFFVGTSGGGRQYCPVFHDGLPLGTGLTVQTHTTVNGNTKSNAADSVTGFAIVGAP